MRRVTSDCGNLHLQDQAALDRCYMDQALALARGVSGRTWPNPPVGAVLVRDGNVVGRGAHAGAGQPHAEPLALADAGDLARGATLYVTLEPCNHTGRTGPCAPAVFAAGVKRVVVGVRDPNPEVTGNGCRWLRDRGVEVVCGVRGEACLDLIWPFLCTDIFYHVFVELKTAVSLDGFFAPDPFTRADQAPVYLTGPVARADVHRRRRRYDLVLVGEGTVRADHPRLDGRLAEGDPDVPRIDPAAGYVDTDLSYAGGFNREAYLVFAGRSARGAANAAVIAADGGEVIYCAERNGKVDPAAILKACAERGLLTVMVEGGPRLASAFLAADLVDRWVQYQAPVVLGRGVSWPGMQAPPGASFSLTDAQRLGPDLRVILDRRDFDAQLEMSTL